MASNNLKIERIESGDKYSKFEIYPFERGFGNTFATPLRRVLLSSIKGTSITSVKIKGVDHEFSTLKGMKEDVLKLVLNLQKVSFRLTGSDKENVVLKVHGKKVVKASDIKVPGNVEVVNSDVELAELTDDSSQLDVEIVIESGFGFELADNEIRNSQPGTIPVNKSFSPVEKVNVNIESTRVAQRTDFEKIVLDVWTDGSKKPEVALQEASQILLERTEELNALIQSFDGSEVNEEEIVEENEKAE